LLSARDVGMTVDNLWKFEIETDHLQKKTHSHDVCFKVLQVSTLQLQAEVPSIFLEKSGRGRDLFPTFLGRSKGSACRVTSLYSHYPGDI